jgi:DNA-directed RNA polymerase subunit K/omega
MVKISKNNTIYSGIKNVDITNILDKSNKNLLGGKNVKNSVKIPIKKILKKNIDNDSEYGSSSDDEFDDDEDQDDEPEEQVNEDNDDQDEDNNNDNYSEKSDKESEIDDEEKNYIDDEEKNYIDDEEILKTKCYSNYAKVNCDDLDFDELFGDESKLVGKNIKISKPILTKYEFVRLLTDRTKQLAQGAKHMLKNTQELSSKEIAKLEIKECVIPLIIERPIPNSKSERWKITELYIPDHFFTL